MKRSVAFFSVVGVLALASAANAQVPYNIINSAYSQSFDTLATTGTANAWSNNVTLLGWYAVQSLPGGVSSTGVRDPIGTAGNPWNSVSTYRAGDGTSNAGALWSFGAGTAATDRALGSIGSGTPGDFVWALVLQNTTGTGLTDFTLNYVGEQWRDGGNTNLALQKAEFDYTVLNALPTNSDLTGSNLAGYTAVPSLDFTSPTATAVAGPLDGNAAANRTALGQTVNLVWGAGQYLVLRWWDDNHVGNDHGLSIDDLSFRATPEPATMALLGLGGLLISRRKR